ncbi:hypothetical protein TRIP_E160203 [uncultured Spirochaetota bacterium]|nr:hypothetical protein TRIP_E160203 [uncultured Spirochaetota bacterium]
MFELGKAEVLSSADKKKMQTKAEELLQKLLFHKVNTIESTYSAVVYTSTKKMYIGFNTFSSTHTLSFHAEQAAIINALLNFDSDIHAIAICSDSDSTPPYPCGICLQLLYENARQSKHDIIIYYKYCNIWNKTLLTKLYPHPWPNRTPRYL